MHVYLSERFCSPILKDRFHGSLFRFRQLLLWVSLLLHGLESVSQGRECRLAVDVESALDVPMVL